MHRLEIWANIINLADATYAVTADKTAYGENYRPGPLRTFYLGIGYKFGKGEHDK
jgi:outer membrane receptor protein involved in Fe transport